jgi:acyl-CoA thioester hydrolase|tara:strand:- start:545 stop:922 length:378 start_codon:yes stop_codon:yes gene_type:complete
MFKLKVYYEDTDAVGFVYYANYLKFLERARTQLLLDSGFTHTFLKENFNIITVVKSCEIDFIKPAKLDDDLEISTSLNKKSKIQLFLDQNIYCDNTLVVKAKVRIVTLNIEGKVSRMPLDLFNIF